MSGLGRSPGEGNESTPVSLLGDFHGQRSHAIHWVAELASTEQLTLSLTLLHFLGHVAEQRSVINIFSRLRLV